MCVCVCVCLSVYCLFTCLCTWLSAAVFTLLLTLSCPRAATVDPPLSTKQQVPCGVFSLILWIILFLSHVQELELVEDAWRGEVQDLLSQITQLQAENKRLLANLPLKEPSAPEEDLQKEEGGFSV